MNNATSQKLEFNQKARVQGPIAILLLVIILLSATVGAQSPVTMKIDKTLIYASPGEKTKMVFTIDNPYAKERNGSIERFDLYLLDIADAGIKIESISPKEWERESITLLGDEHFSRSNFTTGTLAINFSVDAKKPVGKYPLIGYYNYFGDPKTVGLSPSELGEPILPLNDAEKKQFATLVVTERRSSQFPGISLGESTIEGALWILGAITLIAAFFMWWKKRGEKKPQARVKSPAPRRRV